MILLGNTAFSQDPQKLIADAETQMLSKVYGPAIQKLKQAAQADSNNPKIYYLLGQCYLKLGMDKRGEAIKNLEKSVELDEEYWEAWELLGNVYGTSSKTIKKAIASYERAYNVQQDPDIKLAYKLRIIDEIFSVRRYKMAKEHIEEGLKLDAENFDLVFMAAKYYNVVGEYANAIKMMEKIIGSVPEVEGNEQYFYELGYAYFFHKDYKKSDEYLAKVHTGNYSKLKRQFTPEFLIRVADSYFDSYDYDRAEEYRTITVAKDQGNVKAIELGSKLAKVKGINYKAQIEALEKTIDASPTEQKYEELAKLYYVNEQYDEAIATADRFLATNQLDPKMNLMRSACEYQLKSPGAGTQFLGSAIKSPKLTPDQKALFGLMLSMVYRNSGDFKKAMSYLKYPYRSKKYNAVARVEKELVFRLIQGGNNSEDVVDDEKEDE